MGMCTPRGRRPKAKPGGGQSVRVCTGSPVGASVVNSRGGEAGSSLAWHVLKELEVSHGLS